MSKRALFLSTLFAASSWPLLLAAQQATGQADVLLDTVTLQAEGAAQVAGTSPVTTIGAAEITRSQSGSLADVLRDVPGVSTSHSGNILASNPAIRGFGGGAHMGSDPSTQVTVDGVATDGGRVYQNTTGMVADPALLKSVSVLKGPLASLEYGSGINGGTIAMETINGSDLTGGQNGWRFRQLLGANSNGDGWVTSSTLAWQPNEQFDFIANYSRRALDEQEDGNGDTIALDGFNVPSYLLKARYRIDAANSVTLSYNKSESAERDVPYAQMTGSPAFGNVNRDRDGTVASIAWNYNPEGNELVDLELKYSRSEQKIDIEALVPGTFASMFAGNYNLDTDRLTLKNTARFVTGTVSHNLRAGFEWSQQSRDEVAMMNPSGEYTRYGVFAIDQMDLGNELSVTAGLRIERQKVEGDTYAGPGRSMPVGPFETTARTAGLGVEKGLGAGFAAFGSFTYGEGLASLDVFATESGASGLYYGDTVQKSRTWEGGLKYEGADLIASGDRLSASLTAYQTDVWDAMYGVSRSGELTAFTMRGLELQGRYDAASGFYARAVATLNDHEERSLVGSVSTWQDYLYTPANDLSLTLGRKWAGGFDTAWTVRAADSISINGDEHPGWSSHDISVRYSPEAGVLAGASIDFAIENVFDKQYTNNLAYQPEPGRNFKLTLAKTF